MATRIIATEVDFANSNNVVYKKFFSYKELPGKIEKTPCRKEKPPYNSFSFSVGEHRPSIEKLKLLKCETLIKLFGLKNPELFKKKYNQVIDGDGQEWKRITVLHSSSLAALLFFYAIDEYPLELTLEDKSYTFYNSYFEVKTVVCGSHKSNMDVVLEGKNKNGKKVLLFLECKFSEYLKSGKYTGISCDVYSKKYEELGLFKPSTLTPIYATKPTDKNVLELVSSEGYHYCGGIKQMISHYMGVSNYAEKGEEALEENSPLKGKTADEILLGEILFQFDPEVDKNGRCDIYAEDYKKLAERINENNNENPNFRMLKDVLFYQNLGLKYLHNLEEKVKLFYKLPK